MLEGKNEINISILSHSNSLFSKLNEHYHHKL
jgi:hypothetical protein